MKCKFRSITVSVVLFLSLHLLHAQEMPGTARSNDTFIRKGFAHPLEACDTLWKKLAFKKRGTLLPYTVSDSVFRSLVRKRGDTVTPNQLVYGQWLAYKHKVESSYKKAYKHLRKKKINLNRCIRDTVLTYRQAEQPDYMKVELYFSKKKQLSYFRFNLWRVNGEWYFVDKIIYAEESARLR